MIPFSLRPKSNEFFENGGTIAENGLIRAQNWNRNALCLHQSVQNE
jgi:hypothetical protein